MKKVILYTTPTCAFCSVVKKYFEDKGIEYQEVDVSEDEEGLEKMQEKTGQMSVPVILIDEEAVVGFDKKKIEKLLEK